MRFMHAVHFIQHQSHIGPGQLAVDLAQLGARVRVHRAWEGPETLATIPDSDSLVVLGGNMNAYADEDAPWLPQVRDLLARRVCVPSPTLGICLGHQLLAVATGGKVEVGASLGEERGLTAIGWDPAANVATGAPDADSLPATAASDADSLPATGARDAGSYPATAETTTRVSSGAPSTPTGAASQGLGAGLDAAAILGRPSVVFSDHADAVAQIPAAGLVWARSNRYPQVMTVGNVLSVQFHPEVNEDLLAQWYREREPQAYPAALAVYRTQSAALNATCRALSHWLATGTILQ
ncbi:MAG: hypothetical protein Q4P06_06415 [Actinomycetaceae bacterium]|nr:hypothetical protein [Actinomycetaceae bacterium]